MNHEEHIASFQAYWRADYEKHLAEVREWAEEAEAEGMTAAAHQYRESIARLEALNKPWESQQRAA